MPFGWSFMKRVWKLFRSECKRAGEQTEQPELPQPEKENMDALTYMREHIQRYMKGEDTAKPLTELDAIVTDDEREAMHETPFGRINNMLGAMTGTEVGGEVAIYTPPVFKFTSKQVTIIENVHNRFLYALFEGEPTNLAAVYETACSEDEYEQFMDDFPAA